jgi:hypothetical protein
MPKEIIMSKLILITDIIEQKVRKEKELQYYQEELEKLKQKMWFIQKDIDVTNIIINMIETEKVVDFKDQMETKMLGEDDANYEG